MSGSASLSAARRDQVRRERIGLCLAAIPCFAFLFHAAVGVYMQVTHDLELIRRWNKAYPDTLLLAPIVFIIWVVALQRVLVSIRSARSLSLKTSAALIMLLIPTLPAWHSWYTFLTSP